MTVVHNDTRRREQFLHFCMLVRFRFFVCVYLGFVYFYVCLGHFACFVVLGLVSSVLCQEIGWEERLLNDLFCGKWDVKP